MEGYIKDLENAAITKCVLYVKSPPPPLFVFLCAERTTLHTPPLLLLPRFRLRHAPSSPHSHRCFTSIECPPSYLHHSCCNDLSGPRRPPNPPQPLYRSYRVSRITLSLNATFFVHSECAMLPSRSTPAVLLLTFSALRSPPT